MIGTLAKMAIPTLATHFTYDSNSLLFDSLLGVWSFSLPELVFTISNFSGSHTDQFTEKSGAFFVRLSIFQFSKKTHLEITLKMLRVLMEQIDQICSLY